MSAFRRTIFIAVLGLLLAGSAVLLGAQSAATALPGEAQAVPAELAAAEQAPAAPQAARVKELIELRTEKSKSFELADGQREWVGYIEPVHFQHASGAYKEIDNSILSDSKQIDGVDYAYRNAANAYTARFANKADASLFVRIEAEGDTLAFSLVGARSLEVVKTADIKSKVLSEETYGESLLTYRDVLPGVDLAYQPRSSGLKEYLVLKGPGTPNEFTFDLVLEGLSLKQAHGQLSFVDSEGHPVFVLGELAAFDEAEAWTNQVAYRVKESGEACQLTISVPRAYLDDPARVYPVVIDPTIDLWTPTADTYISSANPSTNYSSSSYLRTGRDSPYGIRRSFLKFDQINDLTIDGDDVTSAYLRVEKYSGVTPNINAWWSLDYFVCTSMTWNSGTPHWDGTSGDRYGSPESTTATNDSGNWWRMYVTTPVKYWLNGTYPNYGWMIKDTRESDPNIWTTFYASNAGSPHRPELHIVYDSSGGGAELWEAGFWAWGHQPDQVPAVDVAAGMKNSLIAGGEFDSYLSRFDANCRERDLRDPSRPYNGIAGTDNASGLGFDSVDFAMFVDHGSSNSLGFPDAQDRVSLPGEDVRWGNTDLEWAYIFACHWFDPDTSAHIYNDEANMAGAHGVCGFIDHAFYYGQGIDNDPIARDQGAHFANYLRGVVQGYAAQTYWNAWKLANDEWQPVGTDLRVIYASGYGSEHLPDHGGMSSSDPEPWLDGGVVVIQDHSCSGKVH